MLDILTPRSEPKDRLQKAKRLLTQAASRLQHQSSEDGLSAPESPIVLTVFVYETVGVRWVLSPHPKQVEWAGDCHVDGERTTCVPVGDGHVPRTVSRRRKKVLTLDDGRQQPFTTEASQEVSHPIVSHNVIPSLLAAGGVVA
jgi:hypothetical protein